MIQQLKDRITGKKPTVSRVQVLGARPVRNPLVEWTREKRSGSAEGDDAPEVALLRVPRRKDRLGNVVAKLFKLPDFRKLELDEIGSDVWEMCDGSHSVEALTKAVCAKYRLNRRQAEASVTAYLRMLAERRLIALRTNKSAAAGAAANKGKGAGPSRRPKRA
jgi:hypothetical protein